MIFLPDFPPVINGMTNRPSKTLDSKSELKWLAGYVVGSALGVGLMTDFRFSPIQIQLYDTYYEFEASQAIQYAVAACFMIRGSYLAADLLTTRYRILALFVSIINPILALILIIITFSGVQSFVTLREAYPGTSLLRILVPLFAIGTAVALQVLIEIRMIRKLKEILADRQDSVS